MLQDKLILIISLFALLILIWGQSFEGFENPSVSSAEDVSGGASEYYNWGYKEISPDMEEKVAHTRHHCPRCRKYCYIPVPYRKRRYPCPHCRTNIHIKNDVYFMKRPNCQDCDITKNRDIDKYVLKSSVPPCPDMSQYVKKSQMHPDRRHHDKRRGRDLNCPKCPICPICPKCPDPGKIEQHPEFHKYRLKDDYRVSSETRMGQTGFGIGGYDEPGPGYKTGQIPRSPGNDLGLDDFDVSKRGTTPKAGEQPEPYFKDFAYNNRGSGRVKAYNSVWSVLG